MIYECWTDPEDAECIGLTFTTAQNARKLLVDGVLATTSVPLYSVRAESWDDAMMAHYEIQGWGSYVPMQDDEDDT